ncbi:unnamed protein product, partial [Ascophyllum nodosum]
GVALRLVLAIAGLQPKLESAMELVVPSTSWERAQEGLFLGSMGLSHYAGGVFTGSPLMLVAAALCATLPSAIRGLAAATMFAAFDVFSALLIRGICVRAVAVESGDWEARLEGWMEKDAKPPRGRYNPLSAEKPTGPGASASVDTSTRVAEWAALNLPDVAVAVYLLNPVLVVQCVALSGDVLGRVLPLAALCAAGARRPGMTAAALAAAACLWRFYAAALLIPASLILGRCSTRQDGGGSNVAGVDTCYDPRYFDFDFAAFLRLCGAFVAWLAIVLGGAWLGTSRSWAFLSAAAREQLLCDNLTPNTGLYWYFFAEVFPRFRGFFRVLFLSQPYVYVLPATLRLGMFPEALAALMLAIFGLFHPYPSLADPFIAGCLFLCYPRTSARMRLVIPVLMVGLVPSFLLPIMRHVWLQAGTGNANFYYFQTIILNLMWSMFVLQFAAALVKRRKALAMAFVKRRKAAEVEASAGKGVA